MISPVRASHSRCVCSWLRLHVRTCTQLEPNLDPGCITSEMDDIASKYIISPPPHTRHTPPFPLLSYICTTYVLPITSLTLWCMWFIQRQTKRHLCRYTCTQWGINVTNCFTNCQTDTLYKLCFRKSYGTLWAQNLSGNGWRRENVGLW